MLSDPSTATRRRGRSTTTTHDLKIFIHRTPSMLFIFHHTPRTPLPNTSDFNCTTSFIDHSTSNTEFNTTVHRSKAEAEEATGLITEIEELINLANDKTDQAVDGLAGAKADAELARDIAQDAKEIAERASKVFIK